MSASPRVVAAVRRAVVRWALRLFRREWRQQALGLALLTVSVAAAIGFASAADNTIGVSDDDTFGSAHRRYTVDAPASAALPAMISAAEDRFGVVDVFDHWSRAIPGSVDAVEFRALDPAGAFSAPMLALREGRYPGNADEIAATDGVAEAFGLRIGAVFDLEGQDRTVVGMVESASDLGSEFALASPSDRVRAERVELALLGAGLGTAGAYFALVAGHLGDIGALSSVPVLHLLVIALGIPGVAVVVAWLLAGREPSALTRQAIE